MSDYPDRIYMKPDDLFRVATPAKDAIEYIQRPDNAAKREAELVAEIERLREAVKEVQSHERDPERGVIFLGLRDNRDSRDALKRLFDLASAQ